MSTELNAQFIEATTFKVVIPISEGLSEGLNPENEGLNEGLKSLLDAVIRNPGIQARALPAKLENRPLKTVERQIKELIILELIERQGSRKTGGYFVIKKS
ncbi:hypothetical protein BH09BAC3_BH09BAC3_13400 [soil metagenome]